MIHNLCLYGQHWHLAWLNNVIPANSSCHIKYWPFIHYLYAYRQQIRGQSVYTVNEAHMNWEKHMKGCKREVSYLHHTQNECTVLFFSYKHYALFSYVKFNVCRSILLVFLTLNPQVHTCKLLAGYSWNFVLEVHIKIVGSFLFSQRIHVIAV
jgi:hypothetical protein